MFSTVLIIATAFLIYAVVDLPSVTPSKFDETSRPTATASYSYFRSGDWYDYPALCTYPELWNVGWSREGLYLTIGEEASKYETRHEYIDNIFQCANMAIDLWERLGNEDIQSAIVVGNLGMSEESLEECNHVWLAVSHRNYSEDWFTCYYIETTTGEIYSSNDELWMQYTEGYYYKTPSDFTADTQGRW